ncbi:transposase [Actinoplanes sp. NPDC026619]|uniref:transposase n=1 Tax=Actinoplanes sp. NPDC026619 TaxID=3155798 RepID=UPI0033D01AA8
MTNSASPTPTTLGEHLPSLRIRRYPSDTTDAEWQLIAPHIPAGNPGRRGGRRPMHSRRDIVDAIRYLAHNGCVWRCGCRKPHPPWSQPFDHRGWSGWFRRRYGRLNHGGDLHRALGDDGVCCFDWRTSACPTPSPCCGCCR